MKRILFLIAGGLLAAGVAGGWYWRTPPISPVTTARGFDTHIGIPPLTVITYPSVTNTQQNYTINSASRASRVFVNYTSTSPNITIDTDMLTTGRDLQIADISGNCDDKPITLSTEGSEKINNEDAVTLFGNRSVISLLSNGSHWFTTSVVGLVRKNTSLVSNGSFSSTTTGWSTYACTIASVSGGQSGNCLEITRTSDTIQQAYQTLSLVVGKRYYGEVYIKSGTSGNEQAILRIITNAGSTIIEQIYQTTSTAWTKLSFVFTATDSSVIRVYLNKNTGTAGTMLFDECQIYELL